MGSNGKSKHTKRDRELAESVYGTPFSVLGSYGEQEPEKDITLPEPAVRRTREMG